jgi:hypothetical protein
VDAVLGELGLPVQDRTPPVSVVMVTSRPGQLAHAIEQVAGQTWRQIQLVLVLHGPYLDPDVAAEKARAAGTEDVVVLATDTATAPGACLNLGIKAADGGYLGIMDDESRYGPHFLCDLMPAFGYTEAGIVGKLAHYVHLASTGATALCLPEQEHLHVDALREGTLPARGDLLRDYLIEDGNPEQRLCRVLRADGVGIYAADRYSFVATHDDGEPPADARVVFYGSPDQHVLF